MSDNIYAKMSRQMRDSFCKAKDEALKDVRKAVWAIDAIVEQSAIEWSKANAAQLQEINDHYDRVNQSIGEKINALMEEKREAAKAREAALDGFYHQRYQATQPVRDLYQEEREELVKQWREIEAQVIARYEARIEAKQSKSA